MAAQVTVNEGCIACGLCASLAEEIFEVTDVAHIKAPHQAGITDSALIAKAKDAAAQCPTTVIVVTDPAPTA